MRVFWSSRAQRQLRDIFQYIAERNPDAGYRIRDRIRDRLEELRVHPHMGRPGKAVGTRELVISGTPYTVAYRFHRSRREIEVAAVIHGARLWPESFE